MVYDFVVYRYLEGGPSWSTQDQVKCSEVIGK